MRVFGDMSPGRRVIMCRFARSLVAGLALVALLGALPGSALAVGYEDSLDDCNYPKTFDLLVMRPLSFTSLIIGSVLMVPMAPLAWATVPHDFHDVSDNLIGKPYRFTFRRRLGECEGVTIAY